MIPKKLFAQNSTYHFEEDSPNTHALDICSGNKYNDGDWQKMVFNIIPRDEELAKLKQHYQANTFLTMDECKEFSDLLIDRYNSFEDIIELLGKAQLAIERLKGMEELISKIQATKSTQSLTDLNLAILTKIHKYNK